MPVVPPFLEVLLNFPLHQTQPAPQQAISCPMITEDGRKGLLAGNLRCHFRPSISGVAFGQDGSTGFSPTHGSLWPVPDLLFPVTDVGLALLY